MGAEYVCWGFSAQLGYPFAIPLPLTGGGLRHCRAEQAYRKRLGVGWQTAIYRKGVAPVGLRLEAQQAAAQP
jgi:hypothetical protein